LTEVDLTEADLTPVLTEAVAVFVDDRVTRAFGVRKAGITSW
jgi:hypothetical protein